uniref:Outer membrane protein n=1 Tax=Candidatus Kentrum sp. LFY TaxID=2126342 RepID=A0A450U8Z0_9GAMM|nr:MAG: outer membrane protein [Candidatus Kentron sp. LFY]VFJ96875.1 MAG: outer membrane protein [Candidatus Kentron sp. LFY]
MTVNTESRSFGPRQRFVGYPPNLLIAGLAPILFLLSSSVSMADGLWEIYVLAMENDAEYRGAVAANRASQELAPQARASLLPNIKLSVSAAKKDEESRRGIMRRRGRYFFTEKGFDLTITQPIYHKESWVQLDKAKMGMKQADFTLALARQKLIIRMAKRYFDVLRAMDGVVFAQAEEKAAKTQLRQARQRFDVGLIAITDVQEARAGSDIAVARSVDAKIELDNANEALREVTGEYPVSLDTLGKEMQLVFPEPNDVARWMEVALEGNLELAVSGQAEKVAMAEIQRIKAKHLPRLDLVGAHNRASTGGGQYGHIDTRISSVMLQLNLPIYEGGLVVSQSREAMHRHRQAVEDLVRVRRGVERKTRDAFLGVVSGVSRVKALRQALQSTEIALDATRKGFQVGMRTSLDVLNFQRDMFRAKRDYASARYDYLLDMLHLKQAAGTLSEKDVAAVDAWLE